MTAYNHAEHELRADQIIAKSITAEEALRQIKAEAWDEGFDAGWDDREDFVNCGAIPSGKHQSDAVNPYREEDDDEQL